MTRLPQFHTNLNWYFGVVCRKHGAESGEKKDLARATHLWADMDGVTARESVDRAASAGLPKPSKIVGSGHGAHLYWRLREPLDLSDPNQIKKFEQALRAIAELIASDPQTCNADRILRVPGTLNIKRQPHTPCHVLEANEHRYPFDAFLPSSGKLIRMLWQSGRRHDLALGVGAFLRHHSVSEDDAKVFVGQVCEDAGDEDIADRTRAVEDAYKVQRAAYKQFFDRSLKFLSPLFREALEDLFPRSTTTAIDEHRWLVTERRSNMLAGPYYEPDNRISWLTKRTNKDGLSFFETVTVVGEPFEFTDFYDLDGDFVERGVLGGRTEVVGDANEVVKKLRSWGVVLRERYLSDCMDGIRILSTNNGMPLHHAHKAVGVYTQDGGLVLDMKVVPRTAFQKETLDAVTKVDVALSDEDFEPWSKVASWFRPMEGWTMMGWSAIAPFFFELKNSLPLKGDFTPFPFLVGPHGLGKSTLNRIFTTMLYGTPPRAGKVLESHFRIAQLLDSTTLPIHVAECDKLKFDEYSDKLKAAAEEVFLDARGDPRLQMTTYLARAPTTFDANVQPMSDENLIIRFIIIPFDRSTLQKRKSDREDFQRFMATLRPIGLTLIRDVNQALSDRAREKNLLAVEILHQAVRRVETRLRSHDIPFVDARRAYAWSLIYVGLELWKEAFNFHGISWDLPDLSAFASEAVAPLEQSLREEYRMNNAMQFRGWLTVWTAKNVRRMKDYTESIGRGEFWDDDKSYWYVTSDILPEYGRFTRGEGAYKSLKHLAREVQSVWGGDMGEIYTNRRMGDHIKKTVRIPKGDQAKVDEAPPGGEGTPPAPSEPPDGESPTRKVMNCLSIRNDLFPEAPWADKDTIVEATGLSETDVEDALKQLTQSGEVYVPRLGLYRSVETL